VPNEHVENTGTRKRRHREEASALDSLENTIGRGRTIAERTAIVSKGRRARLRESPREGALTVQTTVKVRWTTQFDWVKPEAIVCVSPITWLLQRKAPYSFKAASSKHGERLGTQPRAKICLG
jgi:hypothetical protein